MKSIMIQGTDKIPTVKFDSIQGLLEIKGRSMLENSKIFYEPLIKWCEEYVNDPSDWTIINIQLEYFDTLSSKYLLHCLKLMKKIKGCQKNIMVNWLYDALDKDIKKCGEDYQEITGLQFQMFAI